ncbi:hypothetical protein DW091_05030 [Eubacterium sp. AM05-23]|uniref:hypothetical protein n=1 Tax=Eubacterium TaxID=1730 RepID=UPI000E466988|nr:MULTISPECIES: hypothetical protein [Eubacterium]RHO59931.1 hypothetical protein DW091_05030 [Eubacterium sp. AM05-23]
MENYKSNALKRWLGILLIVAMVLSTMTPYTKVRAAEEEMQPSVIFSLEKATVDGGADIGLSDGALNVNKDALMTKNAGIDPEKLAQREAQPASLTKAQERF